MRFRIFTVDAFASAPFTGNPAAVMPLDKKLPDRTMQKIAAEMNISETAFLEPRDGDSPACWTTGKRFGLRWMTPTTEVKLCGHATLASAHVLFFSFGNISETLEFETLSGILKARRRQEEIILDLPLLPPSPLTPPQIEICIPLVREIVGTLKIEEAHISEEAEKLVICLDESYTRKHLESIHLIHDNIAKLHDGSLVKGIVVTLKGELQDATSSRGLPEYHFVSRYFGIWTGIPEDPVTGSAHSVLGPYWAKKLGINELECRQCSPRGGELSLTIRDDNRIDVAGKATTVIDGHINV